MDLALFFISGQTIAFVPKKSAAVKPTKQNFYFVGIIIEKLDYFFSIFIAGLNTNRLVSLTYSKSQCCTHFWLYWF